LEEGENFSDRRIKLAKESR